MTLAAGIRLGPYEIASPLGAGGMGEVYKAKDTRLGRDVAVKVLPSHLADNADLRERFEREARAISQLTHPHICTLYDVGSHQGVEYLVMELLEGQTLAERLEKGALPAEQILKAGVEIADALDKAHRHAIIHRDLKPGNVMLTKSGVKLLDFGLAKSLAPGRAEALSTFPTEAERPLTEKGTIMGTFQYMAPEQLEGKEADARTDIFALGAVLHEMATGRKAFSGASRASLIGAIMNAEPPPISSIQPMTPPALDHVVRRCLAKDPDERWQSAADVASELRWIAEAGSQAGAPATVVSRRKSRERLAWIGLAGTTLLAALFALGYFARAPNPPPVIQSSILIPEKQFVGFLALSPDGTRLVFAANAPGTERRLWIRRLDGARAEPIPDTEGAVMPFWSPDGRFLAFFADKKLKKVDLSGGPVVTICEAERSLGGTWGRDGTILFAPNSTSALFRVPSSGGRPAAVTTLDSKRHETTHRYPHFLPDGRHFLYAAGNLAGAEDDPANAIRLGSLDGGNDRVVVPGYSNAIYSSGYVLYARDETLFALPFDAKRLVSRGEALPVAQKVVPIGSYLNYTPLAISDTGVLVFQPDVPSPSRLVWLDRGGRELGSVGEPDLYGSARLSPDGSRLAVGIFDPRTSRPDVWIADLSTGAKTKLASGDAATFNPIWSPDGKRVAFGTDRKAKGGHSDIWVRSIDAGTEEPLLESADNRAPEDWSRDGRYLSFTATPATGTRNNEIWFADLASGRKCAPFQTNARDQADSRFSPDGRWLAFESNESGRFEVYVAPFPGGAGKRQISTAGGFFPRWRGDGRELYFLSLDNKLMAAAVNLETFHADSPAALFPVHPNLDSNGFDVSIDGRRFLVNSLSADLSSPPLTLVANWPATLEKKK